MTHCEHCQISDSDKEVRLSDTAEIWVCKDCHELNPHHSDWDSLKKRPYKEEIELDLKISMSKEAIEHLIEVLDNDLNDADLDLENNSIDDIESFKEDLERIIEEHNFGTGANEVQIK